MTSISAPKHQFALSLSALVADAQKGTTLLKASLAGLALLYVAQVAGALSIAVSQPDADNLVLAFFAVFGSLLSAAVFSRYLIDNSLAAKGIRSEHAMFFLSAHRPLHRS